MISFSFNSVRRRRITCPSVRRSGAAIASSLMIAIFATGAVAQTEPASMTLEGAPSQTGTGALRCVPNETAQLGVRALDANLNRTLVAEYAPQATSTNENVVVARVSDNAASTVNVLCVADGEAWITVEAAGLKAYMPVLVGTARRKASPKGLPPSEAAASPASSAAPSGQAPPALPITDRPTVRPTAPASGPTVLSGPTGVTTIPPAPTTSDLPPATGSTQAGSTVAPTGTATINRTGAQPIASGTTSTRTGATTQAGSSEPAALAAPYGVMATALPGGQVKLTWNAVPGAAVYHILYRKTGETQWSALTDRPGDPLPTGTQYESNPALVVLPAGGLEFTVFGGRDATDYSGLRSTPVGINVKRYDGRYRVTVNGFRVHRASIDYDQNPVITIKGQDDGKGDEVFLVVDYQEFGADGKPAGELRRARTKTHGDRNHPDWQKAGADEYRVQAGTASSLGGLVTGDGFPNQQQPWLDVGGFSNWSFPLFVWEGYLKDGENKVVITPFLIEDDRYPGSEGKYWREQDNWIGLQRFDPVTKQNPFNAGTIQLTFAEAEKILVTKDPNSDIPAGIVTVRYTSAPAKEPEYGRQPWGADYSLYIQVKRIQ